MYSDVHVVSVFFYCYGDHRDLHVLTHSFPTRRSSDLVIVLSLGGCSLAPDFMKPETPVPENWSSARLAAAEKISTDWWRSFDDPALVALVDRKSTRLNSSH